MKEELLDEKQAAALLKVSPDTLRNWRRIHRGPEFFKLDGRMIRYSNHSLETYLNRNLIKPEGEK
jgi:hypothetical protein